jgi:adenosylhomocysteine nucleosidase
MTIGIMSAMMEEVSSLLRHIKNPDIETIGKREYIKGKLYDRDVVLVFSRWGKVASSSTTTTLIDKFGVSEIIFTGVAGSISESLSIGDIVIGEKLYQHDMDARPIFKKLEVPLLNKTYFKTDDLVTKKLLIAAESFITEENFIIKPTSQIGNIGTGDRFVNSIELANEIASIDNLIVVEMEGAAVAQVCYEHNIPFGVVRIVSDNSNSDAHIDFQEFIISTACVYTFGILTKYLRDNIK